MNRDGLAARIRGLIARGFAASGDEAEFDALARAVHAYQAAHCPALARIAPALVRTWREIPLVPTALFARQTIAGFDPTAAVRIFASSGTRGAARSRHYFRDLSLYRASALAGARWALGAGAYRVRSLWRRTENSSLACMIGWLAEEFTPAAPSGEPAVLVIGAAFDYVPLIDAGHREPLPPGSLVVETGGYKGRSRELTRAELRAGIGEVFAVPPERIIGEYGMCELSSPLWERPGESAGFAPPPWLRVRIVDPETLADAERGGIALYDLANLDSSLGLLTADVGRLVAGRLHLEGRLPAAEPRGCSLGVEVVPQGDSSRRSHPG